MDTGDRRNVPSVMLFHGPGAEESALDAAHSYGRLIAPPFGSPSGPRKDDARKVAELYRNPPVSDQRGCLVIGPMDLATDEAADALLKMVEEPNADALPFLWAADVGSVRPTIRSRSHSERPRRLSSAAVVSAALAALAAPTTARISTSIASAVTVVEPTSMAR